MAISDPAFRPFCDDDGGENGANPSVRFDSAGTGQYDIYIGHYQQGSRIPAQLHISEVGNQ